MGSATATFFLEALFPLGDWRWLIVSVVCFVSAWWLIRSEAPLSATRTDPRSQEGVITVALAKVIEEQSDGILVLVGFGGAAILIIFLIWMIRTT